MTSSDSGLPGVPLGTPEPTSPREPAGPPPIDAGTAPRGRLVFPSLILFLSGLSLVVMLAALAMTASQRDSFLAQNTIATAERRNLLIAVLAGGCLPLMVVAGLVLRRGRQALPSIERAADVLSPGLLLGFLPVLFNVSFSQASRLLYLLVLGAFSLLAVPLLKRSLITLAASPSPRVGEAFVHRLRALRPGPRALIFLVVVVASAAYAAYFSFYTIRNHHRMVTTAFDLGIHDNLMFNAMHGHPFRVPVLFPMGGNNLASHAVFAVVWLAPFYAIHPGPETLMIIEATLVGFAAVPLYLFASTQLTRPMAAVLALAYLFFPPLHGPNFYDFQFLMITPFFQFWLFYAIATRRKLLTAVMMVLLYSIREDLAVDLTGLGLFLLLSGIRPRLGLIMAVVSAVWFVIDRFVIMPLAGSWYFQILYTSLFADGVSSFGSVIKTILTNPIFFLRSLMTQQKLEYVLQMLAPLAFLPVRRLPLLLLLLPAVFFTIMTTDYAPTLMISFQYTNHWTPYLFLAATLALVAIGRQKDGVATQRAALAVVVVAMLAATYCFGAVLQHKTFVGGFSHIQFEMSDSDHKRYDQLKELLAMIPPSASVAATENETPHISTRKDAYPLRIEPPQHPDYVLINPSHIGDLSRSAVDKLFANPYEYGLLAQRGDLYLFKRGYQSPQTAAARRAIGLTR